MSPPCYPITVGPPAPASAHPAGCRYGGAPWLSYTPGSERPLGPDGRPKVLVVQLALDALPEPPGFDQLLLQVFAQAPVKGFGVGALEARVVDLVLERGQLARPERPEDALCQPLTFGPPQPDPPPGGRPLERDKLFGSPVHITEGDEDLGLCLECRQPLGLLLHVEGKLHVPYSFGDAGWLTVGWCREHPWSVSAQARQVP